MKKLNPAELELEEHGSYYSKIYHWSSDYEENAVGCEFLYDKSGRLMGVDYPRRRPITREVRPRQENS